MLHCLVATVTRDKPALKMIFNVFSAVFRGGWKKGWYSLSLSVWQLSLFQSLVSLRSLPEVWQRCAGSPRSRVTSARSPIGSPPLACPCTLRYWQQRESTRWATWPCWRRALCGRPGCEMRDTPVGLSARHGQSLRTGRCSPNHVVGVVCNNRY